MKILLVTQWYNPIKGAAAKRTSKMAKMLASNGHRVTVLTGFPSYPTGVLPKNYRWKLWTKEKEGKINIIRTYEYPASAKNITKRLLNMFSFAISATIAAFIMPAHDAIIVSSPSFLSVFAGLANAREKKFYLDVRDLWPDSAVDLGLMKQGFLWKIAKFLEKRYYKRSEKIFVATNKIKRQLVASGIDKDKVIVLLNSVDTNLFQPKKIDREKYSLDPKDFIVCYIGNHSRMYDLENVVKAGQFLKDSPRIKLLLVGEGEVKKDLIDLSYKQKLDNIIFVSEQPLEEIANLINLSDAGLITLANTTAAQSTVPSKMGEYLACAKPIIATIAGEAHKYLFSAKAAEFYPVGNPKELANAILKLYRNKNQQQQMGRNARQLALKVFSDKKFEKTFTSSLI